MQKAIQNFKVKLSGPELDLGEPFYASILEYRKEASILFKKREFNFEGAKVELTTVWSKPSKKINSLDQMESEINVQVNLSKIREILHRQDIASYFLEHFLHEIYTCMNLGLPGSIKIIVDDGNYYDGVINLSSFPFEWSWDVANTYGNWPKIEKIHLKKVITWYNKLNIELRQVAKTNIEKTIFALMMYVQSDYSDSQSNVIWLAHALEAFFSTNHEGILRSIKSRVKLHLGEVGYTKKVNKSLSNFYDYRSRFVHGELSIMKRIPNEVLEKEVDDRVGEMYNICELPCAIILASLQKMIRLDCYSLTFNEVIKYEKDSCGMTK